MKKLFTYLLFTFSILLLPAQKVTMDAYHAQLLFSIKHMTISNVAGKFKTFDVQIEHAKNDFSDAKFTMNADVNTVDTGVEMRDNHLKGADLFDAEKYSKITFASTSITPIKGENKNSYKLTGNLTMHGVTKSVTLNLLYNGSVVNPQNNKKSHGFTISGTLNRLDFGVGPNFPEVVLSNQVAISSNLEFVEN